MTGLGRAPSAVIGAIGGDVEVWRVRTAAEFAAVLEVRRLVFGDEQGIAAGVSDTDDERAVHALAIASTPGGPVAVGTGRLALPKGPTGEAQIAWVATLPAYRGRGVGSAVMRVLLAAADAAGASRVVLSAQTHALGFYRRLGFSPYGERFLVRGIEHQWMARRRSR